MTHIKKRKKIRSIRGGRAGSEKEKRRIRALDKPKKEKKVIRLKKVIKPKKVEKVVAPPIIKAEKVIKLKKETIAEKAVKVITSPKTTAVLATTLATLTGVGIAAKVFTKAAPTLVQKAAQIGKPSLSLIGRRVNVDKIGKILGLTKGQTAALAKETGRRRISQIADITVAARFAVNAKSVGLSTSMVTKLGLSIGAAGLFIGAVGSYPYAGFIKEEAIQTLGFAFNTAERNKDIVGMENAIALTEEVLNKAPEIRDRIPYLNVLNQLDDFFKAALTKLENDKRRLETLKGEIEADETEFQEERRISDEQAQERKLEEQGLDSQYFALIREGKFEEAEELRQSRLKELKGGN